MIIVAINPLAQPITMETHMKNDHLMQVWIDEEKHDWIKEEATKNQRTKQGQVRFWLDMIKAGKIKVEGIGG